LVFVSDDVFVSTTASVVTGSGVSATVGSGDGLG
jgi:hypothetical protein